MDHKKDPSDFLFAGDRMGLDLMALCKRCCQLTAGGRGDQSLAVLVALVLCEVLDEAASQILGLLFPLSGICVGVAGVEDGGVNTGQSGGDLEIEVGIFLVGASLIAPLRIASMMPRVSLMEMRLPVPFQPVLTR